ncbi:MAG TPA: FAD-dependent oxidoreductase [Gemmatimonadales bacterium]|nr:FAD-dependent oxidoreductase [Gemmatimonadales bacterium]
MITADLLSRIDLFARIPESERATLASRAADVRLRAGDYLLLEGQQPAFFGLLDGGIDVYKFMGGNDRRIATYGPGDYFGEVPLLLGAPALASLKATEPTRLLRLDRDDFLEMIAQCRVLSSVVAQTMADRVTRLRDSTLQTPSTMATVIGHPTDPACYDLREFLSRNRVAFTWQVDESGGPGAATAAPPAVILAGGRRLDAPSFRQVAEAIGLQTAPKQTAYDVAIVGGGPAGLAAAVYGASEGLRTVLLERTACGGQAGTSSRIENYLGFPGGLGGEELSDKACQQAVRLGAELVVTRSACAIEAAEPGSSAPHVLVLEDGTRVSAGAIVLATGVEWRRLDTPGMDRLVGHGVFYGASRSEATRMQGKTVHLIGGGNSAGQAAMLFSNYAESVTMLVRGPSLAASMSQYLIDQLAAKANVSVETNVEVVRAEGEDGLEAIELAHRPSGRIERRASDGLFVFIGARAETGWLPENLIRDQWGYVCTGRDVMDLLRERPPATWPLARDPYLLETSIPGVLAAGDLRHGSIKRVSAGVGEGSMAIAVVHQYLAEQRALGAATEPAGATR